MKELLLHNFYRLIEIALFSSDKKAKNTHEAEKKKNPENKTYITIFLDMTILYKSDLTSYIKARSFSDK